VRFGPGLVIHAIILQAAAEQMLRQIEPEED
jgi:hypothetical protein